MAGQGNAAWFSFFLAFGFLSLTYFPFFFFRVLSSSVSTPSLRVFPRVFTTFSNSADAKPRF